ncbi:hypothetical protein ACFQ9X_36510 [Catenulispora yoronensis]
MLLLAAGALSRVARDLRAAMACAAAGIPAAVTTGLAALPPHHLWPVHGGAAAFGLGVTGAYAVLAMIAIRCWSAWFGASAAFCAFGAATAAVVGLAGATAAHAGVVLAVLATALAAAAPMVAMRLGRLPLRGCPRTSPRSARTRSPPSARTSWARPPPRSGCSPACWPRSACRWSPARSRRCAPPAPGRSCWSAC